MEMTEDRAIAYVEQWRQLKLVAADQEDVQSQKPNPFAFAMGTINGLELGRKENKEVNAYHKEWIGRLQDQLKEKEGLVEALEEVADERQDDIDDMENLLTQVHDDLVGVIAKHREEK